MQSANTFLTHFTPLWFLRCFHLSFSSIFLHFLVLTIFFNIYLPIDPLTNQPFPTQLVIKVIWPFFSPLTVTSVFWFDPLVLWFFALLIVVLQFFSFLLFLWFQRFLLLIWFTNFLLWFTLTVINLIINF